MTKFEQAGQSDIEAIVSMMDEFYAIDNYPFDAELATLLLRQFISDGTLGKLWLIYFDGNLAGYVVLTFIFSFEYGGKIAFIDELFVLESFRNHGIGKETLAFIRQQADKLLLKLLYLEIEPHNTKAQKLYIAADFKPHPRKLMRFQP